MILKFQKFNALRLLSLYLRTVILASILYLVGQVNCPLDPAANVGEGLGVEAGRTSSCLSIMMFFVTSSLAPWLGSSSPHEYHYNFCHFLVIAL